MNKLGVGIVSAALFACLAFVPADSQAAGLRSLTLQATGGVNLTPTFAPTVREYRTQVQSDIATVHVRAEPDSTAARISVTVNGKATDPKAPAQVALVPGINTVEVRVTADESSTAASETYRIVVERQDLSAVEARFLKLEFIDASTGARMPYRLYVPERIDRDRKLPLVVFLHGGGERGDDNVKPLTANQGGTVWALPEEQAKRPCFVLVPQARAVWDGGFGITRNPENQIALGRVFTLAEDTKTAHRLLMKVLDEYPQIDRKRLYLTGLSQGGFGAWNWNLAQPSLFAAFVAVAGGADPQAVSTLRDKPVWAFHAASDPVIPVDYSRNAVAALRAAGGNVRYTEYPADTYFFPMAHFSWVPAFRDAAMREWLFAQSR